MKIIWLKNGAATNSLLLVFVTVITTVFGMVVTKLLSVNFSLNEYGTYSQALLVTSTATSISILGLTNATNYFYNRTSSVEEQKKYISTIFAIQYIAGLLCTLIIVFFRGEISLYFANSQLKSILLIVSLTPAMSNLISMYQTLFVSIGEAKKIAARNFIVSSVKLIGTIAACYLFNNIVVVLILILVMDIAQVLYFSYMFKRDKFAMSFKYIEFSLCKEILAFSIPMAIYVLSNSLSRDIDKYVISAFADTETLAIYSNASKVLPFDMLTSSLITVLIPIITRFINGKEYGEAQRVFKLYLRMGYILTFIFAGGAVAVARQLMLFLYDEKYIGGLSVFIVYLIIDMIRFANVTTVLSGAGKSKILMYISITTLAANAVFNVLGYKALGILGPAVVTLVLTLLMTCALLHFGAKEINTTVLKLFDFKEMGVIILQIILVGALSHLMATKVDDFGVPLFFTLALSYGTYAIILLLLNRKRIMKCYRELNQYN